MYGWRSEEGVGVLEFVIALPVVMLVLWGGFAMSLHLLDGMLVKYGAYEEARRAVLHNPSSSYLLPVARVINGWGSGVRGLILTGSVKKQGKDIVVTVTRTQPGYSAPSSEFLRPNELVWPAAVHGRGCYGTESGHLFAAPGKRQNVF